MLDALHELVDRKVGVRLLTLMQIDHERQMARRVYSSMPDAYPLSGEKTVLHDEWSARVIGRQEIFIANSPAEIAAVFPDHAQIAELGCASCVNLPIVVAGRVLGTLNCLHVAGHFTAARIKAARALQLPGALTLLLLAHLQEGH